CDAPGTRASPGRIAPDGRVAAGVLALGYRSGITFVTDEEDFFSDLSEHGSPPHEPLHGQPARPRVQPVRVPERQGPVRHRTVRADGRRDRPWSARGGAPAG